jgi:hypothetical protein
MGNFRAAQTHLRAGVRFLEDLEISALDISLVNTLHRFDVQAWTMSDATAPYHPARNATPANFHVGRLNTLSDASAALMILAKWAFNTSFNAAENPDFSNFEGQKKLCKTQLEIWKTHFDYLKMHRLNLDKLAASIFLEIYYTMISLTLDFYSQNYEMAWDLGIQLWRHIVDLGEQVIRSLPSSQMGTGEPILSLEMGVIVPLFFTAMKCREPSMRRRAIALLSARRWREGV